MKFSDMVKSGYFMYMAEAEGCDNLVNTRTAKLNAIRNQVPANCTFEEVENICLAHGITSVSSDEFNYITKGKSYYV